MTPEEKREIIEMYNAGFKQKDIAAKLGVKRHIINQTIAKYVTSHIIAFQGENPIPMYHKEPGHSRAYFMEHHGNDGMESYKCGLIMKKRKRMNELYDLHAKIKWGKNQPELLTAVNYELTQLENELGC